MTELKDNYTAEEVYTLVAHAVIEAADARADKEIDAYIDGLSKGWDMAMQQMQIKDFLNQAAQLMPMNSNGVALPTGPTRVLYLSNDLKPC